MTGTASEVGLKAVLQRFQPSRFGRKSPVFSNRFRPTVFAKNSPVFCSFPLAKEENVFPASLVFLARSFLVFLWYLGLPFRALLKQPIGEVLDYVL